MTDPITKGRRWGAPAIDRHEDYIVARRQEGYSIRQLQRVLRKRGIYSSKSTISRYLRDLPKERLQHRPAAGAHRKSGISGRQRFVSEVPAETVKKNFRGRNAKAQAEHWVRRGLALSTPRHRNRSDGLIHSLGTKRNYEGVLKRFCTWIQHNRLRDLEHATPQIAMRYLEERAGRVAQKTLDLDRQAIQFLFRQTMGRDIRLVRVKSTYCSGRRLAEKPRAYTRTQLLVVTGSMSARAGLAARLCYAAGLRAQEVLTIRPRSEQSPSGHRTWSSDRFAGRAGVVYTVAGKGGLRREVMLPRDLATELEQYRLSKPKSVNDRGIYYKAHYDLTGGNSLSRAWQRSSDRVLGWSTGLHGLRHGYAQDRMTELAAIGFGREERQAIVSQELGHFRITETESYLR